MSKVEELRVKYPYVTKVTFNKFVESDKTPTKKYLDYMLKIWSTRDITGAYVTVALIIETISSFEELLPYIDNKDVYSKEYLDFNVLRRVVEKAAEVKEDKLFIREEHVNVLIDNEKYLVVHPKTHKGSVKYGANTKWCTAAKRDVETYKRYMRNGYLVYVIDKKGDKQKNYEKLAFYFEFSMRALNDHITVYNAYDSSVHESTIRSGGWDEEDLFEIFTTFRYSYMQYKRIKKDVDTVDSFLKVISTLNFTSFEESLLKLEQNVNVDYISTAKTEVDNFINKIKELKYAKFR